MKSLSSSILFVAGLSLAAGAGVLATGCQGESDGDESDGVVMSVPRPAASGPAGTGGVNSLLPSHFHAKKYGLIQSFTTRLSDPSNPSKVNPVVNSNLNVSGSIAGERTLHYAASCALDAGDMVTLSSYEFLGGGFILKGESWHDNPIIKQAEIRNGILTCMAARLNPYGKEVKILELGPSVPWDGSTTTDDYPFREMVISAVYNPGIDAQVTINVWPLEDLKKKCGIQTEGSLGTRICDNNPGLCGLVLRNDFATACTGTPGSYTCDGVPAIETRLKTVDFYLLHPSCEP